GPADHDRQTRLDRARLVAEMVEGVAAARDRGPLIAVEQVSHGADGFIEPVEPLAEAGSELDPVGQVLGLHPGAADAQDRPAVARVVEGRGDLGDEARIAERGRPDEQPESRLLRLARPGIALDARRGAALGRTSDPPISDRDRSWREGGVHARRPPLRPRLASALISHRSRVKGARGYDRSIGPGPRTPHARGSAAIGAVGRRPRDGSHRRWRGWIA